MCDRRRGPRWVLRWERAANRYVVSLCVALGYPPPLVRTILDVVSVEPGIVVLLLHWGEGMNNLVKASGKCAVQRVDLGLQSVCVGQSHVCV